MVVDYGIYCKNTASYLFWLKTGENLSLNEVNYSFNLKRLLGDDDPRILSCFYLFRYFLGVKAGVTYRKKIFQLGVNYYDFEIGYTFSKKRMYFPLYYWVYEIQSSINNNLARDYCISNRNITFILWDVNIFTEKKTNTALFDLSDPLYLKIMSNKGLLTNKLILLNVLKFVC